MSEGIYIKTGNGPRGKTDTEHGLTRNQRMTLLKWEKEHAGDKNESIVAIDRRGKLVAQNKGNENSVSWAGMGHLFKDNIISHNHPGASIKRETSKGSYARRIGFPFFGRGHKHRHRK